MDIITQSNYKSLTLTGIITQSHKSLKMIGTIIQGNYKSLTGIITKVIISR